MLLDRITLCRSLLARARAHRSKFSRAEGLVIFLTMSTNVSDSLRHLCEEVGHQLFLHFSDDRKELPKFDACAITEAYDDGIPWKTASVSYEIAPGRTFTPPDPNEFKGQAWLDVYNRAMHRGDIIVSHWSPRMCTFSNLKTIRRNGHTVECVYEVETHVHVMGHSFNEDRHFITFRLWLN